MHEITSKSLSIESCTVHYLETGDPSGRTVILLHGMKFQAATWQELGTLEQLAMSGCHAVAIDMPGFGRSPACNLDQETVLHQCVKAVSPGRAVLVGPSMGGRIALEFAINHQEMVDGLVLVGAVGVEENRKHLPSIKVPALIVWGGEDQVSPLSNSDILNSSIPVSKRIIIDGAPHPCYLDSPEQWHSALIDFTGSL